ncbi:MAG: pyrroline-5-carboxylate reductase [Hyphomicrobiaceae bacterium]
MSIELDGNLALVGCGKMGFAMLSGWIAGGVPADRVIVQEPSPTEQVDTFCRARGIRCVATLREAALAEPLAVAVMAVKPQVMTDVLATVVPYVGTQTLIVSIAAGRTIASFEAQVPASVAVIRTIPNTPAAIGRGITVCCGNSHVTADQQTLCERLLAVVGEVGWVEDEGLIDAATAVSGSGPAYVFLVAEALAAAGVEAGLSPELARRLADATVSGAGELLRQSHDEPAQLRRDVTSPNGTTEAALRVLMAADGLGALMTKAVLAARDRSRELAN